MSCGCGCAAYKQDSVQGSEQTTEIDPVSVDFNEQGQEKASVGCGCGQRSHARAVAYSTGHTSAHANERTNTHATSRHGNGCCGHTHESHSGSRHHDGKMFRQENGNLNLAVRGAQK